MLTATFCISRDSSVSELFIVRENIAVTANWVRDRMTQAVLSVDESILKIKGSRLDAVLENNQVRQIIALLGVGLCLGRGNHRNAFSLSYLRYGKIIIALDATPEGRHIRTQLVSFFHRFNLPVLAAGHVYIATADLWVGMTADEFSEKVMAPESRRIVQLRAGKTIAETLNLLDSFHQ